MKVVVITNVWSGPGLAAAILLSRRGFKVFGTVDEYVSTTEELPFTQIQLKRGDTEAVRDSIATLLSVAGCVDVLVNISETYTIGALEELSEEQTNRHFADSFFEVLRLTYAVIPFMRARGMGEWSISFLRSAPLQLHLWECTQPLTLHLKAGHRASTERWKALGFKSLRLCAAFLGV